MTTIETTPAAASVGAKTDATTANATSLSGALRAGGRAYVSVTLKARSLREVAELQAAWVQHRAETSTAHVKEFADLAHTKTMDVIAPFAALLKQDKPA